MINCPLTVNQHGWHCECMGEECAFWSLDGNNCLIAMALSKYIQDENEKKIKQIADLTKEIQQLSIKYPYSTDLFGSDF